MMPMTMMPNRSLFNIQSSKITARARTRAGGGRRLSPGVPFSGQKRGLSQYVRRHCDGHRPRTEAYRGSLDSSRRCDSVDTNFFFKLNDI